MKRLLKISFDLALLSFVPVLSWFCLSLIIDKNLINIFTLTYPIQFTWYMLKAIFSTGANINKIKDNNSDAVMSGFVIGTLIAFILYSSLAINMDKYIAFMNMDINIYRNFAIYSVLQLFVQLIFSFVLEKLYYEEKNTLANKYSIIFNLLNFCILIGSALIFKNQIKTIVITLLAISIFTFYISIKSFNKFKLRISILKWIKYDSVQLFNAIAFFLIFLFGLSNALDFGSEYALALTFVALITDTQWDAFDAISTVAKVDISKNKFNYKEHKNNAYKLLLILLTTVAIMFVTLFRFYNLDIKITFIYISFELVNFLIYPIYRIKTCFLQLEYSSLKTTINKVTSCFLRMIISLLKTPFCTGLGQISSSIYQFISINLMFDKNFLINKQGIVERKK